MYQRWALCENVFRGLRAGFKWASRRWLRANWTSVQGALDYMWQSFWIGASGKADRLSATPTVAMGRWLPPTVDGRAHCSVALRVVMRVLLVAQWAHR